MNITFRLFLTIVFILPSLISHVNAETMNVGYFDLSPHGTLKNGKPVGIALEYFNLVAKEMGVKFNYTQEPLSRLLKNNKLDMILYLAKTPERLQSHVFSNYSLIKIQGSITVASDSSILFINDLTDIAGMTVRVWQEGYISPLLLKSKIKLEKLSGDSITERSLQMVHLKRIQGFYSPEPYSVIYCIRKLGLQSKLRMLNLPESAVELYPVFTKLGAIKYQARFERAFKKIQLQKPYAQFLQNNFNRKF